MTVFSTSEKKRDEALKVLKADHFIVSKDEKQMQVRLDTTDTVCLSMLLWYTLQISDAAVLLGKVHTLSEKSGMLPSTV